MLSTVKKDKKRRVLVEKFEIKNLYAKVIQHDRFLKNAFEKKCEIQFDDNENSSLQTKKLSVRDKQVLFSNNYEPLSKTKEDLKVFSSVFSALLYEKAVKSVPRNSSKTRVKNRCIKSGRSRSVFKFCRLSRIGLREEAAKGAIPGICKASW